MTNKDYFQQNIQCVSDGTAVNECRPKDPYPVYSCKKFQGVCQMNKCVASFNNLAR